MDCLSVNYTVLLAQEQLVTRITVCGLCTVWAVFIMLADAVTNWEKNIVLVKSKVYKAQILYELQCLRSSVLTTLLVWWLNVVSIANEGAYGIVHTVSVGFLGSLIQQDVRY